jgi:hypothetical protein
LPNIGRKVTAGSAGTRWVKAAFASSLGFGIDMPLIALTLSIVVPHGILW